MVGGHDLYASVGDGTAQLVAVGGAFYCRVPLDLGSEAVVVDVCEPEVMHADFAGDLSSWQRFVAEHFCFFCS